MILDILWQTSDCLHPTTKTLTRWLVSQLLHDDTRTIPIMRTCIQCRLSSCACTSSLTLLLILMTCLMSFRAPLYIKNPGKLVLGLVIIPLMLELIA